MPAPISLDLRQRIVNAYKAGHGSYVKLALIFGVSRDAVRDFVHLDRQGKLAPKPATGGRNGKKLFEEHYQAIEAWLKEDPELFWWEVAQRLKSDFDIQIDPSQISRQMKRRGFSQKKRRSATRKQQAQKSSESEGPGEPS